MASQAKTGYKVLLYLLITTQSFSATLSFLILFALPIPLFIQLKNGTTHQSTRQSSAQLRRRSQEPPYSTHNLYLMHLALVDLAYLLPLIAGEFCTLTPNVCNARFWSGRVAVAHPPQLPNSFDDKRVGFIIGYPYAVANIWLNAIIAHEVWHLDTISLLCPNWTQTRKLASISTVLHCNDQVRTRKEET